MRPPITSEKHIVQFPIDTIVAGTHQSIPLVTVAASGAGADIVPIGSILKAIYIELWLQSGVNAIGSHIFVVEKLQNGGDPIGFAAMAQLNDYNNKRNVFYTTEGLLAESNANPIPVIRQWLKIPKGKQRMAQGDKISLSISAQAGDIDRCGLSIYKSYT